MPIAVEIAESLVVRESTDRHRDGRAESPVAITQEHGHRMRTQAADHQIHAAVAVEIRSRILIGKKCYEEIDVGAGVDVLHDQAGRHLDVVHRVAHQPFRALPAIPLFPQALILPERRRQFGQRWQRQVVAVGPAGIHQLVKSAIAG